jgi:hypothetical protein
MFPRLNLRLGAWIIVDQGFPIENPRENHEREWRNQRNELNKLILAYILKYLPEGQVRAWMRILNHKRPQGCPDRVTNGTSDLCVTTPPFFFENIRMDFHSGMTTCRLANIWHMPHNMYLIIKVISNNGICHDTIIIIPEKHIYNITCC